MCKNERLIHITDIQWDELLLKMYKALTLTFTATI